MFDEASAESKSQAKKPHAKEAPDGVDKQSVRVAECDRDVYIYPWFEDGHGRAA